jgi:hypothetical protein
LIEFRTSKVYPNVVFVCDIEFLEEEADGMRILPLLLRRRRRQRGRSSHFRARERWPEKRREQKREIEKREESYGGSFRAARLSGGCYRSHRTTGGLLVVTYNSHPIRPSTHPSIHPYGECEPAALTNLTYHPPDDTSFELVVDG